MDSYQASDTPYPRAPEDMPPTPRRVGLRPRARLLRGTLLAGAMLGPVAALLWGFAQGEPLRELATGGQTASGRFTEKYTDNPGDDGRSYHVRYSFTAEGRPQSGDQVIGAAEYAGLTEGKPCGVTYLPGRPEVHCLGDARALLADRGGGVVYFALAVAGVLTLSYVVLALTLRGELRLARVGEPVAGRVTDRGVRYDDGTKRHWASYRFTAADGTRYTRRNDVPPGPWNYLAAGLPVLILQDPDHPSRRRPMYAFRYAFIDISPPEGDAGNESQTGYEA